MTAKAIFVACLFLLPPASQAFAQASPARSTTVAAPDDRAKQWLTLLDDANYAQSWGDSGANFKAHNSAAAWARQGAAEREPLGAVVSRDLKDVDLSHPQTAVVRYDSSFAHKTGAVETVTLAFEKGGWSVTGYAVK